MPLLHSANIRHADLAVAISGFMISFFGSLPLGTTNVLTIQLASSGGMTMAVWFALGCLAAELLYVRVSLALRDVVLKFGVVQKILRWVSAAILAGLAIASFAAVRSGSTPVTVLVPAEFSPFLFGFLLMAVNPVQLPFWFGWSTVLFEAKRLSPEPLRYVSYMAGVAVGSALASTLFILAGHFLVAWLAGSPGILHFVIGVVYLLTALYLVWQGLRRDKGG